MSWAAVNRITVDSSEEADRVVAAFRARSRQVDLEPGFLGFELWREIGGKEVLVLTRWSRREDFVAWTESPAFRHAHARAAESPGIGGGSLYEIVQEATPSAGSSD
ncbi:MAG TPA: antibiotic biosynthesis monooxygenase family protein [Thermoplasmata archaeon]|nr:antibiotic biosynthesis monooxygenase family protein [Thermoplasmata archaeon]